MRGRGRPASSPLLLLLLLLLLVVVSSSPLRLLFLLLPLLLPFLLLSSLVASPTPFVVCGGGRKPETFLSRESPVVGQVRRKVKRGGSAATADDSGRRGRGVVALVVVVVVGFAGFVFAAATASIVKEQPSLHQHPAHALPQDLSRRRRLVLVNFSCLPAATLPDGAEEAGRRRRKRQH